MNGKSFITGFSNGWVIIGGILLAGALLVVGAIFLWVVHPASPTPVPGAGTAIITMIPAPTSTPVYTPPPKTTPTPTSPAQASDSPIAIGLYVQIIGTGGAGLNIRSSPGIASAKKFLGMDAEVFRVNDGPQEIDGLTWWFLQAPYDDTRNGWAAAKYLAVIQAQPTPSQ